MKQITLFNSFGKPSLRVELSRGRSGERVNITNIEEADWVSVDLEDAVPLAEEIIRLAKTAKEKAK